MYTARVSEQMCPLAGGAQGNLQPGVYPGAWVSLQNYHRAWLIVGVGNMAAGATFDCQLLQAQDVNGTGSKVILRKSQVAFKAITRLTQAGGDAYSACCIELQTEELDVTNGFHFVCFLAVVGEGAVEAAVILFGCEPRHMPVPTTNWDEIVD